jgi:predicted MFS family arabinose efflux permease
MVISSAFSCLAALFCTRILNYFGEKTKYIISVIMGLSILSCAYPDLRSAAFFFILANAVNSLIYPIESSSLNALIPSAQRATIISVDSMCYSVSMILFFPLCGVVATYADLHVTFAALGILQLCLMGLLLHRFISA